jgi:hypothetical protein
MKIWIFTCGLPKVEFPIKTTEIRSGHCIRMKTLRGLTSLYLLTAALNVTAAEEELELDPNLPNLEFLEFLGSFESDAGNWIDPGSLITEDFGDFLNAAIRLTPEPEQANATINDQQQDDQ